MKNLAPQILRKRLLIEARYESLVTTDTIREYLFGMAQALKLKTYGEPTIHSTAGEGKDVNQGFDAFVPLIDSGISLYIWTREAFLSCVLYTCKDFSTAEAIRFTTGFFRTTELESQEF